MLRSSLITKTMMLAAALLLLSVGCVPPNSNLVGRVADINGCFKTISTVTSTETGRLNFNTFGRGDFFIALLRAGGNVSFNFGIDTNQTPGVIIGGVLQNDMELLTTVGSRIFAKLNGTATGPNANGVITFSGTGLIFGGTAAALGAKGEFEFNGAIYTQGATVNGVTYAPNEGTFCFDGHIRGGVGVGVISNNF